METTMNIHAGVLKQITLAAQLKGLSRSEIIIILIKKVMDEKWKTVPVGRMVKYQKKCNPGDWHAFHLSLREDDYEYFLDLRKLLKMSVSLILAYAVDKYLQQLITCNITDNYRFIHYVVVKEIVEDTICWRFYWGCPATLQKYF